MGAGVGWQKGKQAGFFGTPLFRKGLKLAKKTEEDWKGLLKGLGNDNPLNKGMGERALMEGPGCREEKMKLSQEVWEERNILGLGDDQRHLERVKYSLKTWAWVGTNFRKKLFCLSCHMSSSCFFLTGQQSAFSSSDLYNTEAKVQLFVVAF